MADLTVTVNRAPVLTLWGAVVAERLGFDWDEAHTLGRAVAGLNAYSKGVRLGLFTPAPRGVKEKKRKLKEVESCISAFSASAPQPCKFREYQLV